MQRTSHLANPDVMHTGGGATCIRQDDSRSVLSEMKTFCAMYRGAVRDCIGLLDEPSDLQGIS